MFNVLFRKDCKEKFYEVILAKGGPVIVLAGKESNTSQVTEFPGLSFYVYHIYIYMYADAANAADYS